MRVALLLLAMIAGAAIAQSPPGAPAAIRPHPPRNVFANGGVDANENFCWMVAAHFPTQIGSIYSLEASRDLLTWEPCPPEIDGTGEVEAFYDAIDLEDSKHYRVSSRVGVLPPYEPIAPPPPSNPFQAAAFQPASEEDGIVPVPVVFTNGQHVAFWYSPFYVARTNFSPGFDQQTNATMWVPERSADGANWSPCGNQFRTIPPRDVRRLGQACFPCLNFTETDADRQIRIRRVPWPR